MGIYRFLLAAAVVRTWSCRRREPTSARVRPTVTHAAVEDTARIDTELLQIVE